MEAAVERNKDTVASISLLDSGTRVLASVTGSGGDPDVFAFQVPLEAAGGRGWGRGPEAASTEWSVEIKLYSASADFITRQAFGHAVIAGIAISTLLALGFYFTHTLKRFLLLKSREESERHLASLGAMSATLAHEIRNPLGAMKGLTQVVQEDLPNNHRSQELMKTVIDEAERLEQLVTDLLIFARPVELRLADFDLASLLQEVCGFLTPQALELGAAISFPDEMKATMVHSDRDGLRQVLLNLILNAVEASPKNADVEVQLLEAGRGRRARVVIRDYGPGLGELSPEELFLPFKTTKVKGSGLGLAVSKRIVDRLGGAIRLEDSGSGGTLCTLEIPYRSW
jgi:two-component system sensor histidine kinase HydH